MTETTWNVGASQYNDKPVYWCIDPTRPTMRWHVSYNTAHTFGTISGQVLEAEGWYWYTASDDGRRFSSMVGPFSSAEAAMADCEVAGR